MKTIFFLLLFYSMPILSGNVMGGNECIIHLSGEWHFALDSAGVGEKERWFDTELPFKIHLPGTTDEAGYGTPHNYGTNLYMGKSENWQLARKNVYIGKAWYQRKLFVPEYWKGKRLSLILERCMWHTKLWVNGIYAGEGNSLCTPHRFNISSLMKEGANVFTLQIDNSPYVNLGSWSHGYSSGIQTIWNGVVGDIVLKAGEIVELEDIQCFPSFKNKQMYVNVRLLNDRATKVKGNVKFTVFDKRGKTVYKVKKKAEIATGVTVLKELLLFKGYIRSWDEYTPELYVLEVRSSFGGDEQVKKVRFGFRDVNVKDGRLIVNESKIFLRGEHDAGSFPLTGYPSMKKNDWLTIFRKGKAYGFNHWRFHSWCPPEAAFEAADEIGIYLQPELPLFSQECEHTLIGRDVERDEFLFAELKRIVRSYGNHPSFMVMCMGNELRGDSTVLKKWVTWGKQNDNRHLYVSSANLEAMGRYLPLSGDELQVAHAAKVDGKRYERRMAQYFNEERPNTSNDYSHTLHTPYNHVPIVAHETGQWTVYPDFSEMKNYKGVLCPYNLQMFRDSLEKKGMLDLADEFMHASGKLAALLYKEEMERVLRTPRMGGFQLLDLRDYQAQGSALVGLLNVFWESKGLITEKEFRQSCDALTVLLKMPQRVWRNSEIFTADVVVPNYMSRDLEQQEIMWSVLDAGRKIASGKLWTEMLKQGEVNFCGNIRLPLKQVGRAAKLEVRLVMPRVNVDNSYDIWVYPQHSFVDTSDIVVARKATLELLEQIEIGKNVLLIPDKLAGGEKVRFTTAFWSTILFNYQIKTMGICCNPDHPLFRDFPTDAWANWQWWELMKDATAVRLNGTPTSYRPILQVIDHPVRNDKLGAIVETSIGKGKLLVCTFDILSEWEKRPVAQQLFRSIMSYMKSPDFAPKEVTGLADIFWKQTNETEYKNLAVSKNVIDKENVKYAFDKNSATRWRLSEKRSVSVEIELPRERYIVGCRLHSKGLGSERLGFKVFVSNVKGKFGQPVIIGRGVLKENYQAELVDNGFTIQKGAKGKYILICFTSFAVGKVAIDEFDWIFGD